MTVEELSEGAPVAGAGLLAQSFELTADRPRFGAEFLRNLLVGHALRDEFEDATLLGVEAGFVQEHRGDLRALVGVGRAGRARRVDDAAGLDLE